MEKIHIKPFCLLSHVYIFITTSTFSLIWFEIYINHFSFVICFLSINVSGTFKQIRIYKLKAFYVPTQSLKNAEVFELNSCPISKSSRKFYE